MNRIVPSEKPTTKLGGSLTEPVNIGLSPESLNGIVDALTVILADQHVLYIKTRHFHWNLKGPRFQSLHALYESQYTALAEDIDQTAERIRMLGHSAPGSMATFLSHATLEEEAGHLVTSEDSIEALLHDHQHVVRGLRSSIVLVESTYEDAGTADFLTGLLQKHEEAAWMLRSMQPEGPPLSV